MDIAVRRVNSLDTNYGMALKYHTHTVVTGYKYVQCTVSKLLSK